MNKYQQQRFVRLSILLSIASIVLTIIINIRIGGSYTQSDNKTKALFGVTETLRFSYQYAVAILPLAALVTSLFAFNTGRLAKMSTLLSLLAILLIFGRIWRLFV